MLKKIFFSLFLLNLFLVPDTSDSLVTKVRNRINDIKPFKVQFINRVVNNSEIEIEEKGEMLFLNKDRIKWIYKDPNYKVWIVYGNSYEYYDREEEQITKGKLSKKTQIWIFKLLDTKYEKNDIKVNNKKNEIYLVNDEEGINFKILISDDFLPSKIIQKDPTGVDIVYIFSGYKKNITLSDKDFILKIDGEVDIIDLK